MTFGRCFRYQRFVSGVRYDRPGVDEVDKHEYLLKAYAVTDYVARRQSREELMKSNYVKGIGDLSTAVRGKYYGMTVITKSGTAVKPQPALTDKERETLLDALELACEHATVRKRSAIKKVYDKLVA